MSIPNNKYQWWDEKEDKIFEILMPYVRALETQQAARRQHSIQFAKLYQNQNPAVYNTSVMAATYNNAQLNQWSSRNVIKAAIDTATNKIGKNKPRPLFLTEDGQWSQRNRAKQLQQFMDGQFDSMQIYTKGVDVFRDGGIFGHGHMKFFVDSKNGTVGCERVLPDEIIVDEADAMYGTPRQIHHRKYVAREDLIKKYPDKAGPIRQAKSAFIGNSQLGLNRDLVKVIESFYLPTTTESGDGLKVICIETATLDKCEWEKMYFPIVTWRWCPRVTGFYGLGIAEELYATQLEINSILKDIQIALKMVARPRVFVQNGTMVSAKIDNNIGAVIKHTGPAPVFQTATAMTGEIYNHLQWLVDSAFEQIGVSQMTANGAVPAGLEAAVAMREYADQTSERFMSVGDRWEQWYLDCARVIIDLTKDLMNGGTDVKVKVQDGDFLKTLDWKTLDLAEDKYTLRMWAANILPTTPSGKLSKVQELIQSGLIPQDAGLRLLDFPDLKAEMNQMLASDNLTDKMIELALEKGKYMAPEPQMNLAKALSTAQNRFLEAKLNGCPSRNLGVLDRWMEAVKGLLPATPQAVSPMAPVDPAAGGATAVPQANPQSDLMPFNTPQ